MLRSEFARQLLAACGFRAHDENLIACLAWFESERAHDLPPTGARFNPTDTTEPWGGATDYNSAGVKNYATLADGIAATKATLFNGRYANVVSAFTISRDPVLICQQINRSPWGSKPTDSMVTQVRAHFNVFGSANIYDVEINTGGEVVTPSEPAPAPAPPADPPTTEVIPEMDRPGTATLVCALLTGNDPNETQLEHALTLSDRDMVLYFLDSPDGVAVKNSIRIRAGLH